MPQHEASDDLTDHYSSLLAEQTASGLSVAEFAREVGLTAATLYTWRRRLQATSHTPQLVEVCLSAHEQSSSPSPGISVIVGDRFRVDLQSDFDAAALERLLEVLARC